MATGNPLVTAIRNAERDTTGEIHVHISRKWFERDPVRRARTLFALLQLHRTSQQNAVLLYFNTRRKKFAVIAGDGWNGKVAPKYWDDLAFMLQEDLVSTAFENAVGLAIQTLGATLKKSFPKV